MSRSYIVFDAELGHRICDELATGKSLRTICAAADMPDRHTVRRWAVQYPDFRAQYEQARLLWADEIFEQIAERAGEACQVAEDAEQRGLNPQAAVGALREEIRGLQWVAARLRPDKYGDRIAAEVSGPGGAPLIPANRETRLPQLVAALAVLLPGTANAELFDLAGALLDRLADPAALPAPKDGDDGAG